jgi:FlaA1/EpsC-like NDP-sugar epimerase
VPPSGVPAPSPRRMGPTEGAHMFLVTGATGNVGAELVRAPAESGERVRAVSRSGRNEGVTGGRGG